MSGSIPRDGAGEVGDIRTVRGSWTSSHTTANARAIANKKIHIVADSVVFFFFFQAEDGIRDLTVTGVQTCALPILHAVKFLGFRNQSELPSFYDLCDVFVLPSTSEPWGLVVNEAMAAGRPVVVSDQVGCARDLVQNGLNGFIFPVGDVEALAHALTRVLVD